MTPNLLMAPCGSGGKVLPLKELFVVLESHPHHVLRTYVKTLILCLKAMNLLPCEERAILLGPEGHGSLEGEL